MVRGHINVRPESVGSCYVIKLCKVVVTALRADSFYTLTMVMPVIAVTIMSTMGMLLPANSGEKMGLQITLLLTLVVFIQEGFQVSACLIAFSANHSESRRYQFEISF